MFRFTCADVGICGIGIFERFVDAKHRCAEIDVIGDDRFDAQFDLFRAPGIEHLIGIRRANRCHTAMFQTAAEAGIGAQTWGWFVDDSEVG